MANRMNMFATFLRTMIVYALHIRELMLSLIGLIVIGGVLISQLEDIRIGDAIYFAFITALSIGYGDITPTTFLGKVVSVGIGFIGMLFVGLTVAVATRAMADTAQDGETAKD